MIISIYLVGFWSLFLREIKSSMNCCLDKSKKFSFRTKKYLPCPQHRYTSIFNSCEPLRLHVKVFIIFSDIDHFRISFGLSLAPRLSTINAVSYLLTHSSCLVIRRLSILLFHLILIFSVLYQVVLLTAGRPEFNPKVRQFFLVR